MNSHDFLIWSGILAVTSFILSFATCFRMPWNKNKCHLIGSKPDCVQKDRHGILAFLKRYHHYFVLATLAFVAVHVTLVHIIKLSGH